MNNGRGVTTRVEHLWLDDEGIVHADGIEGSEHTKVDAEEATTVIWEVARRQARPLLVDMRRTKSMDRDARAHYAGPATVGVARAVALLTGSPLTRVLASFFMGLSKPVVPTRMFTSEAEALAWLRGFLA
jgi:hypothetical protein